MKKFQKEKGLVEFLRSSIDSINTRNNIGQFNIMMKLYNTYTFNKSLKSIEKCDICNSKLVYKHPKEDLTSPVGMLVISKCSNCNSKIGFLDINMNIN